MVACYGINNNKLMKNLKMKRKFIISICMTLALTISMPVLAQERQVKGAVYDDKGEPVIGATVAVKGTKIGTVTDLDGKFVLSVPQKSQITITYIGFLPQTVDGSENSKIVMLEDRHSLDEVVVVGYGSQKMKNVTGAVETINASELKDLSVGNLSDALVGQFNGLGINSNGTRPGQAPSLQIRQSDVSVSQTPGSTKGGDPDPTPLYVIDGFISNESNFNNLDVSEVESITVLKDAAAAVYGSRAAYGVVLVKTKHGKAGAPKISYTGQIGWTDALFTPKMLSSYDYGRIWNAVTAAGTATKDNVDITAKLFQSDELEQMKNTNYNLLDQQWSAAFTQRHGINIDGGNEKATYFIGGSYYTQDGNIGRLDFDRWNYRGGVDAKIGKWVDAALQVSGTYGKKVNAIIAKGGGTDGDYENLMTHLPFVPSYMNGYPIVYTGMQNVNTLSAEHLYNYEGVQNCPDNVSNMTNSMNLNGSLELDMGWIKPLQGLKIKASYSKNIDNSKNNTTKTLMNVYGLANRGGSSKHLYVWDGMDSSEAYAFSNLSQFQLDNGSILGRTMSRSDSYQLNLTASYARKFGLHDVGALFSIEKSESESEDLTGQVSDPLPYTDNQSASASGDMYTSFGRSESGILSYVGRFNYAYADKYLLEFLIRSDASTKFAPKDRWGTFPSVSAGWVMSEEKWFKQAAPWFDFLKIRGSWGLMGRDNIAPWLWKQLYTRDIEKGGKFGLDQTASVGTGIYMPAAGVNENVHWDKNYESNVGIDARFLNGRLSANFDYYYNKGRDMFMVYTGTTKFPTTVGTQASPENYGAIDEWGWELTLGWRDKINKDFNYWVKLSTGYSDNKILKGAFQATPELDGIREGERTDRGVWGYKCLGMFRSYQEIQEYFSVNHITQYMGKTIDDVHPGMLIYEDVRGDNNGDGTYTGKNGKINENDYIQLSKRSDNPYGLTVNFGASYKDFSLTAQMSASWGAYTLMQTDFRKSTSDLEYQNIPSFWKDMYVYQDIYDAKGNITVPANTDAAFPNMKYQDINSAPSSFWLVSAAQITLRNITVSWALPKNWINPIGVGSVRLNLTCQNAIYFLNPYPDHSWASYAGTYGRYPNLRKITMGVNVSF